MNALFEIRKGEVHAPNANTRKYWLGRCEGRSRSGAVGPARLLRDSATRVCLAVSGEGEIGCLFDEISDLVEPIERPATEGWAG
jgi:hypothetical protein